MQETDDDIVSIYVTADSEDVAIHIATSLVNEGLAACANIHAGIRSIYRWNDVLHLEREVVLFLKSTRGRAEAAVARAATLHNAKVPCILVLPVVAGHTPYMDWVRAQTEKTEQS